MPSVSLRGPGKKENYNLDYSRFDRFDQDEDEKQASKLPDSDEADAAAGQRPAGMPDMRELLRGCPPELQEAYHVMAVAKENGDAEGQRRANELALKAVEKGGPEVRNAFLQNLGEMQPELAGKIQIDGGVLKQAKPQTQSEELEDTGIRIDTLRKEMLEGQKATRAELDGLQKKQEELEGIRSPEDFFAFMKQEGMNQEDLQRMFMGDEEHMKNRIKQNSDKDKEGKDPAAASLDALNRVDKLHGALFGEEEQPEKAPEPVKERPVREALPKEPEVIIPVYRLQYEKDELGKYTVVELKCTLPGVADMSVINLDISEKHLRLSTVAPAPRYAVNAGPFPVLIDPSGARAKYSKKREELSISVPAKLD